MTRHYWNPTNSGGGTLTFAEYAVDSEPIVVNDTDQPQAALTGTTPILPAGDYEITISYLWSKGQNASCDFIANLLIDGASVVTWGGDMHRQQPASVGGGDAAGTLTSQAYPASFVIPRSFATNTTHTYQFQFQSEMTGERSAVRNVSLSFRQRP